jgi:ethanolamine utilization protein EutN
MILGRVIGHVWAARRDARLQRSKLLVIRPHAIYEPAFATRHLVATDDVDAGVGDDVIVCLGAPARASLGSNDMPVDAAVLGVVDRIEWQPDAMQVAGAAPGIKRALGAMSEIAGARGEPASSARRVPSREGSGSL